jgi:hypothetical protein
MGHCGSGLVERGPLSPEPPPEWLGPRSRDRPPLAHLQIYTSLLLRRFSLSLTRPYCQPFKLGRPLALVTLEQTESYFHFSGGIYSEKYLP